MSSFILFAGIAHLTFAREEFQAQVPSWLPIDPDPVVLGSGVVEIALGAALIAAALWFAGLPRRPAPHTLSIGARDTYAF